MALRFGKTVIPNFRRIFQRRPRQMTLHPYMNFLRAYKFRHPSYGFHRILQDGAIAWKRLPSRDKMQFSSKEVMKNYQKRSSIPTDFKIFARQPIPMDIQRRSMSTSKNVKRSWRKLENTSPRVTQKLPQHATTMRLTQLFPLPAASPYARIPPKLPHQTISNYRIFARQPSPIPLHPTESVYRVFARRISPIPRDVRRRELPERWLA